jgi:hypothetical protein
MKTLGQVTVRAAVVYIARELFEKLLPDGTVIDCLADKIMSPGLQDLQFALVHRCLKLPANSRVTGISVAHRFAYDQVSLRVECPDFVETQVNCLIPEVRVLFWNDGTAPVFRGWEGPALREDYGKPIIVPLRAVVEPLNLPPVEAIYFGGCEATWATTGEIDAARREEFWGELDRINATRAIELDSVMSPFFGAVDATWTAERNLYQQAESPQKPLPTVQGIQDSLDRAEELLAAQEAQETKQPQEEAPRKINFREFL